MSGATKPGIRLARSLADVDAAAWDRLAADDVYARHGWLRTVEETVTDAADPVYFLHEDGGELTGAAIGYRLGDALPSSLDELLLGRLAAPLSRLGISLGPALVCGPLLGQGRHVLWRREIEDSTRARLLRRLLDAITDFAAGERLSLAFVKLPVEEAALLDALAGRGFARSLNWPVSVLDIRWDSFDAYLVELSAAGMATKARRECAAPAKAGIELARAQRFGERADELFALVEANHRNHTDAPLGIERTFFHALARHHAGESVVTVARTGAELEGAALLLTAGRCAGGPLIGVGDSARNRKAFTYFNLSMYAPIQFCIERGLEHVYLGAGLYDTKRRRGCRELELVMLIRHRSAPGRIACRLWCAAHRRWAMKKLERQGVRLASSSAHRQGPESTA